MNLIDITSFSQEIPWKPWAVAYFMMIGPAIVAALFAAWRILTGGEQAARGALTVAAVFAIAAPLLILVDVHQPARFYHFYLHPSPQSIMWWGSVIMPLFMMTTVLRFVVAIFAERFVKLKAFAVPLTFAMAFFALGTFTYTVAEITVVAARPLWHNAYFPLILIFTNIAMGVGAVMLVDVWRKENPHSARLIVLLSSVAALVVTAAWLIQNPVVRELVVQRLPISGAVLFIGVGLVLVTTLLAFFSRQPLALYVAGFATFIGALGYRWTLFIGGQAWSKSENIWYPMTSPFEPAALQALSGTLGMFAMAMVLVAATYWIAGKYFALTGHSTTSGQAETDSINYGRRAAAMGVTATGAAAAMGYGFAQPVKDVIKGLTGGFKGQGIRGNAHDPEYQINDQGKVTLNQNQYVGNTMCMGCTTKCSVRVRVDKNSGEIIRVTGNPYSPLSTDPHLPYNAPISESIKSLSRFEDRGLAGRSTACGRGNAALSTYQSPHRVLKPLKRVGPRGSGQWEEIAWEDLIREVSDGGDLFGEGHVDGLSTLWDKETLIDADNPEFGAKVNQLVVMPGFKNGRLSFVARFAKMAFGTRNMVGHRSYCGLSMRAGYGAMMDNLKSHPHLKPDYRHVKFMLFIGTAPSNAGNPFKLQGTLMAKARADNGAKYVVVDPVLTNSLSRASGDNARWLPIIPGTDSALAMGMIQWIITNQRYDQTFLTQPSKKAAQAVGELSWTNATHLVIDDNSQDHGKFVRWQQIDPQAEEKQGQSGVCFDNEDHLVAATITTTPAKLFYEGEITLADGRQVKVATSFSLLKRQADRHSLAEYSQQCGIAEAEIIELADTFTSYGKLAAADTHGGTMHASGFYTAYGIVMLNTLIGNINAKGGAGITGGTYKAVAAGPRYNLRGFPGKAKPKGIDIGRGGFAYEKTSEFKRKVAAGENPYPAKAPWHRSGPTLGSQYLNSVVEGYPYHAKALITWSSNPVYSITGMRERIVEKLKDPKVLPLMIAIDPFINETTTLADYIVPDRVFYEAWGWTNPWGAVLVKDTTARWPVVKCRTEQLADGRHMDMESFFIDVAKHIGLPGFGDKAIPDAEGKLHPLNKAEDFWLRAGANVAFDGEPVNESSNEEMVMTGVSQFKTVLAETLKADEWRRVAYILNRGGRFADMSTAYRGESLGRPYGKPMQIWNEDIASAKNSLTGESFIGCPTVQMPTFADGSLVTQHFPENDWPFKVVSTKSQLFSSLQGILKGLVDAMPTNAVGLNNKDAEKLGVETGDEVQVISPNGSITGRVLCRRGIAAGTIAIEHGFGHRHMGANSFTVDGKTIKADPVYGTGINQNELGCQDPTTEIPILFSDPVVGSVARQAIPAKIVKV